MDRGGGDVTGGRRERKNDGWGGYGAWGTGFDGVSTILVDN